MNITLQEFADTILRKSLNDTGYSDEDMAAYRSHMGKEPRCPTCHQHIPYRSPESIENSLKCDIMDDNDMGSDWEREIYYSYEKRKVISYKMVDAHDSAWLQGCIDEAHEGDWKFYFQEKPSDILKATLIGLITNQATSSASS